MVNSSKLWLGLPALTVQLCLAVVLDENVGSSRSCISHNVPGQQDWRSSNTSVQLRLCRVTQQLHSFRACDDNSRWHDWHDAGKVHINHTEGPDLLPMLQIWMKRPLSLEKSAMFLAFLLLISEADAPKPLAMSSMVSPGPALYR
jgi:hypothetical protein